MLTFFLLFHFDQVDVAVSSKDSLSVEVVLRCLAADGDGIGFHMTNDGGLLAAIMAAGFKGILYVLFDWKYRWFMFKCNELYKKETLQL